jgi:release factor glutamine methyltransferase
VPDSDGLPPEVGQWEPAGALFGGPDGTRVIAEVLAGLGEAGIGAPVIGLEIGQGQGELVAGMVRDAGWPETEIRLDLAGIDRVVVGRGG